MPIKYITYVNKLTTYTAHEYIVNDTLYIDSPKIYGMKLFYIIAYPYIQVISEIKLNTKHKKTFKLIDHSSLEKCYADITILITNTNNTRYIVTIRINTYILLVMLDELSKG